MDPDIITETDIDTWAEILAEEERAREYAREVAECCGGRDWLCGHYGKG